MQVSYKFRIYPNREQKTLFAKTFGCVRFIYNKMLDDKIKYYEKTKKKRNNTPAQYKKEFPWLKEVDSLALANAQMNLQKAYNNFFRDPKVGFPKFKSRHKTRASYTMNNQKGTVALEDGCLKLPKAGYVKIKQHRAIPEDYRIKSVTIRQNPGGDYYASVLFEYENQVQKQPMPIMNGYETATAIRSLPKHKGELLPIIAMTANAFTEDVILAKSAGMNEHIAKPLDMEKLNRILHEWM